MPREKIDITKVRHNHFLYKSICEICPTPAHFCALVGISESTLWRLLRFRITPLTRKKNDYSESCKKIAEALGLSCGELFPCDLYGVPSLDLSIEFTYCHVVLEAKYDSITQRTLFDEVSDLELKENVRRVLMSITPRQERVLRDRFGIGTDELSTEEIAHYFELTQSRIRDIEEEAMFKLRHPSRAKRLEDLY